jgi:hypothetical protein
VLCTVEEDRDMLDMLLLPLIEQTTIRLHRTCLHSVFHQSSLLEYHSVRDLPYILDLYLYNITISKTIEVIS